MKKEIKVYSLRLETKLKQWVANEAKKNRRSINAELNTLLDELFEIKNKEENYAP